MAGVLNSMRMTQVGFVVRDVETTKKAWADFLGVPVPPTVTSGEYDVTGTIVKGEPSPDAACKMAFFELENIQLELIEPNGVSSCWQDFLDQHGEGIHHVAFGVNGTSEKLTLCTSLGMPCAQRGKYSDGSGEYAYVDATQQLKCFIETLESF